MMNRIIKITNEFGMVSEVEFGCFKTDVRFGFSPDRVEFLGCVDEDVVGLIEGR